jgi:hypothetical protein
VVATRALLSLLSEHHFLYSIILRGSKVLCLGYTLNLVSYQLQMKTGDLPSLFMDVL